MCNNYLKLGSRQAYPILQVDGKVITVGLSKKLVKSSVIHTVVKIISYISLIIPLIAAIILLIGKKHYAITINKVSRPSQLVRSSVGAISNSAIRDVVASAPQFNFYRIGDLDGHRCDGMVISGASLRPANFFYSALLHDRPDLQPTLPGQGLFAFPIDKHQDIRDHIRGKPSSEVISFSALGKMGNISISTRIRGSITQHEGVKFEEIFGSGVYQITYGEVERSLEAQRIYLTPDLPRKFYFALKNALSLDKLVCLPGTDNALIYLKQIPFLMHRGSLAFPNIVHLLEEVARDPKKFGFCSEQAFRKFCDLTLYEIGSMVVKIDHIYLFTNAQGKILNRTPGKKDELQLISLCGIRGIHWTETSQDVNRGIMENTFSTALKAACTGVILFSAVGMGVWQGPPELYWPAFLNGVIQSGTNLQQIFVNPGHQVTRGGMYAGSSGDEFETILNHYKSLYPEGTEERANLEKIVNLRDEGTDIFEAGRLLKEQFPDLAITIVNASDPDVTLGYHVTEYSNNKPHGAATTEEALGAMSSSGISFEQISGVRSHRNRVISC